MGNIKEIKIKNRSYYFSDDMINIEDFDPNLLKIDTKRLIFITLNTSLKDSDYIKIKSVNPLYLIINEVDGYIKEKNGNKYLIFNSADKNKEVLKKYTELWNGIKNEIDTIYKSKEGECSSIEYGKDFMKIKFDADDNLPLNKTLELHNTIIIIRFVLFILKFI